MPTLIETRTLEDCAALCQELGLSFIELNMNMPEYQAEKLDVKQLVDISEQYRIYFTIHIDENFNPCDFNDKVASAYKETIIQTIEFAKILEIPILNMHLAEGVYFTLPNKKAFLFDEYEKEYQRKLMDFRDACASAIGDADIKICIENTSGYNRAPFINRSIDILLDSPVFGLTFDIGHNAGADFVDETYILSHSNRLSHMHIHDAMGKNNHMALGDGELDLMKYMEIAKTNNCRAVLETKTIESLRHSVQWLNERGYR
jgi:sugar phosphate isomerase/epimerase